MSSYILSDGTCIPSHLGIRAMGSAPEANALQTELSLRIGQVKQIIYPTKSHPDYGTYDIRYLVELVHKTPQGSVTTDLECTASNWFGGVADTFRATFRADSAANKSAPLVGIGAKVLVLCVSGDQNQAIIIGGIGDRDKIYTDEGHNLFFEFNGFQVTVDKDGQAKMTFRGATKADGSLADSADPKAEGSNINFEKNGNINVATPNMQTGNVTIKSAGVLVGAATDAWVLGTTYRNNESNLNNQVNMELGKLAGLLTGQISAIGGVLAGMTNPQAPPASVPQLLPLDIAGFTAVAAALTSVVTALGTIAGALTSFESGASSYLSTKNKTD